MVESRTFGLVDQGTTREFFVAAALHFFENNALKNCFLDGEDNEKMTLLMEILRLEPQAYMIYRTASNEIAHVNGRTIAAGDRISLNIRAANIDEAIVGPNTTIIDPDRARKSKNNEAWMRFGDGMGTTNSTKLSIQELRYNLR